MKQNKFTKVLACVIILLVYPANGFIPAGDLAALGDAVGNAAVLGVNEFITGTTQLAQLTSSVLDGASFVGTSIQAVSQSGPTARSCAIEIRNYHKDLVLTEPHVFVERGFIHIPPSPEISPGYKEVCMFRKTHGSATGSYGVLTYKINKVEGAEKKIVSDGTTLTLMWGIPWGWEWNYNYQAVGISPRPVNLDYDLFNKMYYKDGDFIRKEAMKTIVYEKVVYGNVPIKITTTMNDESRATWIINIA